MEKKDLILARDRAVDEIKALVGLDGCVVNSALQHTIHWIKGYRDEMLGMKNNIYSPGSARDISYRAGIQQAEIDKKEIL